MLMDGHVKQSRLDSYNDPRGVLMVAAHESAEDAALRSARCATESIADLNERTVAVARTYSARAPMIAFLDARAVRDLARTLAQRAHRPSDLADLYLVLGQVNALMGSIAFDLGNWQAAATLARSATAYAELAGHSSLQAWTLGLQGTLAFWRDEPEQSLKFLSRGFSIAPAGTPRYRLQYIASRAHAVQRNARGVEEALTAAQADMEARDAARDELNDSVRGEFAFDDARAAACAAAAWLHLKNGEQAAAHAKLALNIYAAMPEYRRPFSPVMGATIDLAAAHLLSGSHDEAQEELEVAFALPREMRNASLAGRLARVKTILAKPELNCSVRSRDLPERIDFWLNETAAKPEAVEGAT
jgi:hypothetical protein